MICTDESENLSIKENFETLLKTFTATMNGYELKIVEVNEMTIVTISVAKVKVSKQEC